jgi:1,4-dihydroxy-2-naphthoate octaprenyltransferase
MFLGEIFVIFSLIIWMAIKVGPWWVPLVLFSIAIPLNLWNVKLMKARQEKLAKEFSEKLKQVAAATPVPNKDVLRPTRQIRIPFTPPEEK